MFTSANSSYSIRHGAWFHVDSRNGPLNLFIKKWDPTTESLIEETSDTEKLHWRANLGSVWREGLTPYRQTASRDAAGEEEKQDWQQLTAHITPALLTRIMGDTPGHWSLTSASSAKRDMDDIPGLTSSESGIQAEKELDFLPIDLKRTWRPGATGRERTDAAQDRSWALGELVEHHCTGKNQMEVLGEMELCFLMVLTLNNYSCLEQWKRILKLLFTCRAAVMEGPELFVMVLATLKLQLQHCNDVEGGLFDLSDEGSTLLRGLIREFRKGLEDFSGMEKADVMDELEELESYLRAEYGWEFDDSFVRRGMLELEDGERVEMDVAGYEEEDESGEYAPTVVELTPAQMKALSSDDPVGEDIGQEDDDDGEEEQDLEDMDARY